MENITETTAGQSLSQDLNDLMGGLDLGKLLPELGQLLGKLETWVHLSLFIIPFVMSVLGIWYLFFPPKEANRHVGFRSLFAMGSPQAWRYAQKLAGIAWGGVGIVLLVLMLIVTVVTKNTPLNALVPTAIIWLIIQLALVLVCYVAVQAVLASKFDYQGKKRPEKN